MTFQEKRRFIEMRANPAAHLDAAPAGYVADVALIAMLLDGGLAIAQSGDAARHIRIARYVSCSPRFSGGSPIWALR